MSGFRYLKPLVERVDLLRFEQEAWSKGFRRVAGVDEAGRGPWAGPVVAAAVIFDPAFLSREVNVLLDGLTDSKQLSSDRREHFFGILTGSPSIQVGIGQALPDEIDAVNILQATHRAMARALAALNPAAEWALVDGRPVTDLPCPSTSIVRGDSLSISIAAASVVAKVTRDRIMVELDRQYPDYGFARHKGYGTREHQLALRRHGPLPVHRRSFEPVRQPGLWDGLETAE